MAAVDTNHINDRIQRLTKYVDTLKGRLLIIPAKYKGREQIYKDWVELEIRRTQKTIESLR